MNRRAAGVVFIALGTTIYAFAPSGVRYGEGEVAMLSLLILGVIYLYLAETEKVKP